MPLGVTDRPIRPLTADEVLRMVEAGILDGRDRVELFDGVLIEKLVKSPAHEAVKSRLIDWLRPAWDSRAVLVRIEAPLLVRDRYSLPEPDIAVVAPREYLHRHPSTAYLVVEVALTSLAFDANIKAPMYAGSVDEYWVVDVASRTLHVHRAPGADGYAEVRVLAPGESVQPKAVPAPPLELAELFAGL